ncbi:MAG: tetratricopeptide repeat protein [Dehalococcoidales bacterium]|nr:tetratricopeptide repeat protein [Dehalococcoidales bacterium]
MKDNSIAIWQSIADEMINNDLEEEALYYFNKILEIDPVNHEAVENKAYALHILGKGEEAIEYVDQYLEHNPFDVHVWILKGDLLSDHYYGEEAALECYNQALAIDAKNQEAWVKKAYALKEKGSYAEAADCFMTAIELFQEKDISEYPIEYQECFQGYSCELCEEFNSCLELMDD